jgi:hypothetical protein
MAAPLESEAVDVPEVWLHRLAKAVAGYMTADTCMGPLGCCFDEDEGFWQINLYPTSVELVGGAADARIVAPGFSLNIERFRGLFDRIDDFQWESLGFPGSEGPHVVVEGVYRGHEVLVQVLAYAPEDEESGLKLDMRQCAP